MENSTEIVLPLYTCHKNVRAVKIGAISAGNSEGRVLITPEDPSYRTFATTIEYVNKHLPHDGGYYVQYEDGYESFSPADVFEAGYTLIGGVPVNPSDDGAAGMAEGDEKAGFVEVEGDQEQNDGGRSRRDILMSALHEALATAKDSPVSFGVAVGLTQALAIIDNEPRMFPARPKKWGMDDGCQEGPGEITLSVDKSLVLMHEENFSAVAELGGEVYAYTNKRVFRVRKGELQPLDIQPANRQPE